MDDHIMMCMECGLAEATISRSVATKALPDGPTHHTNQHFCHACFEPIRAREAIERAATEEEVRIAFADGSAFTQIRAEIAPVIARGIASELAQIAEHLDFIATAQPTPLPTDLQEFADRHRRATLSP